MVDHFSGKSANRTVEDLSLTQSRGKRQSDIDLIIYSDRSVFEERTGDLSIVETAP